MNADGDRRRVGNKSSRGRASMLRKREMQGLLGRVFIAAGVLLGGAAGGWGEEKPDPAKQNAAKEAKDAVGEAPATLTVEKLTEAARKSVVVVTVLGRDG